MRQKQINKMLKGIKSNRNIYSTYGKIVKVTLCHLLVAADFVIPTFRLLTVFALKFTKHIELFRLTIKD
ncbi:MAG: hypothetical protein D4S01_07260 [Dehalococcoidia bacterium]|nr:MAG: hypothetical protein D4S01_07260 [Dehalococcoidia bacterium]